VPTIFLLSGVLIGTIIVSCLTILLIPYDADPRWRGYITSIGAGIIVGTLIELLPLWMELVVAVLDRGLNSFMVLTPLSEDAIVVIHGIIVEVARVISVLLIVVIFLRSSSTRIELAADTVDKPEHAIDVRRREWTGKFTIPAIGEADWLTTILVIFGLGTYNLWHGMMKSELALSEIIEIPAYLSILSTIGALRTVAVSGLLISLLNKWYVVSILSIILGVAEMLGILWYDNNSTWIMWAFPIIITVITLSVALGRMLRRIQTDIGLGWKTTATVLVAMLVSRQVDRFILSIISNIE